MISTDLSPNVEPDDVALSKRLWFRPGKYRTGEALDQLTQRMAVQLGVTTESILLYNSGRSALYSALQSLQLQESDEVLMQAYTCNAVPNPVLWAGSTPVFVDVDPQSLTMTAETLRARITPNSKVLIVQHSFGFPAPMDELMAVAREHGLIVIEDCALALGARYKHKQVGTIGDIGLFSFGRDKIISSVYGGMLTVNNPQLLPAIVSHYEQLSYPAGGWVRQQLQHPIVTHWAKKTYTTMSIGKIILELSKRLGLTSLAVTSGERRGKQPKYFPAKLPNALAALADHQLQKLEQFRTHRERIAALYRSALQHPAIAHTQQPGPIEQPAYLRYTILVANPAGLYAFCKERGILLGDWYSTVLSPTGTNLEDMCYVDKSCPTAEHLATQSINLPTHINISENDAQRIVSTVLEYVNQQ